MMQCAKQGLKKPQMSFAHLGHPNRFSVNHCE